MNGILKKSFFNIAYKGCNVIYPMLISAYISRVFMAEGVGQVSFLINIVTYFSIAASLGIPNYALKVITASRGNKEQLKKVFSELAVLILISSTAASVLYYCFSIFYYKNDDSLLKSALALGLIIVSNALNYDWLYEAEEDYEFLAKRTLIIKIIAMFAMFFFVRTIDHIFNYCLIYAMVTVLNNFSDAFFYKKYTSITIYNLNIKSHLKPVMILFAAAFATEIYTLLDSTMLGVMCPSQYLGLYSNASKTVRAIYGVVFAATGVYNPRLGYLYGSQKIDEYKKVFQQYYNQSTLFAIPATVGIASLSKQIIIVLFGTNFSLAGETLGILAFLIIVFTLATVFGHIPLVIYGKEKVILRATITGAIVNFCLNRALIPRFYHNGAAIASIISEMIVTGILLFGSIKVVRIKIITNDILTEIIAAIVMAACLEIIKEQAKGFVSLGAVVLAGALVYFGVAFLLNNKTIRLVVGAFYNEKRNK